MTESKDLTSTEVFLSVRSRQQMTVVCQDNVYTNVHPKLSNNNILHSYKYSFLLASLVPWWPF